MAIVTIVADIETDRVPGVHISSRLCENAHLKELGRGSVTVNLNFFANWLLSMVEAL
jgi:hypothetical protein